MCLQFILNNKQDRISQKAAIKSVMNGRLGIPDLRKYFSLEDYVDTKTETDEA